MGGLPWFETPEALAAEIQQVFSGVNVKWISNLRTPLESKFKDDGKHQYCHVDLGNADDAQAAVEGLDGKELASGADYKIQFAREKVQPQTGHNGNRRRQQEDTPPRQRNLGGSWRATA